MLLTGPSLGGLADAGHATLLSLCSVTAATLASKAGAATLFIVQTLNQLTDDAGDAYLEPHRAVEANGNRPGVPAVGTPTAQAASVRFEWNARPSQQARVSMITCGQS